MKLLLSKNLILAVVVVAALTAGTGLLAGYVDGPKTANSHRQQMCRLSVGGNPFLLQDCRELPAPRERSGCNRCP